MMIAGLVGLCGMAKAAFVTIGNAGNAADTANGGIYGDVAYTYRISVTEVTIAEFTASGAGSGNENYWNDDGQGTSVGPNAPASRVSLYEAMQYCNYITSGNINLGAYVFSGGNYQSTDRASAVSTYGTVYALPTEDEWYKAAYFKTDASGYSLYANGTANVPTHGTASGWNYYNGGYVNGAPNYTWTAGYGGVEQNGTVNMMGNVWEWMETSSGVLRGGGYGNIEYYLCSSGSYVHDPVSEGDSVGFRVVAIPEPATALILGLGGAVIALYRRFFGRV